VAEFERGFLKLLD